MLDDLREQAGETDFIMGDESDFEYNESSVSSQSQRQFLGMTPVQRFIIAFMILLMACVLGSFFLLVTEKIYLSFF
jgi:hypothetical protein